MNLVILVNVEIIVFLSVKTFQPLVVPTDSNIFSKCQNRQILIELQVRRLFDQKEKEITKNQWFQL